MLAALNGQAWNASQVGKNLGLSYHTVNTYLDYLEGAFLIRRLRPYQANIGKRLIKSPKIYWRDGGLLHALLKVADGDMLLSQPWVGTRTSDQREIDLLLDFGKELWAVEIKLTASPDPGMMARLEESADSIKASRRFLVSQTPRSSGDRRRISCNLPHFLEVLREYAGD